MFWNIFGNQFLPVVPRLIWNSRPSKESHNSPSSSALRRELAWQIIYGYPLDFPICQHKGRSLAYPDPNRMIFIYPGLLFRFKFNLESLPEHGDVIMKHMAQTRCIIVLNIILTATFFYKLTSIEPCMIWHISTVVRFACLDLRIFALLLNFHIEWTEIILY